MPAKSPPKNPPKKKQAAMAPAGIIIAAMPAKGKGKPKGKKA
jgi:hypothetical protein